MRGFREKGDSLSLYFGEYQPAIVPATSARGVFDNFPLGSV